MDRLYAPWRMTYIKSEKTSGCIFCESVKVENDRQSLILLRGESCFVIMNKYPYTNGHLMVAPYAHIGQVEGLPLPAWTEMMALAQRCVAALKETMDPHGFNLGLNIGRAAGAGMEEHVHLHLVPRWNGDVNFMSVFGDVRVINQQLEEGYEVLAAALNKQRGEAEPKDKT